MALGVFGARNTLELAHRVIDAQGNDINSELKDRFASPPRRGALGDRPAPVVVSPISKVDGIRRRSTSC